MTPASSYLTVARDADAEVEVKRSRFLCTLRRVEDEAAARAHARLEESTERAAALVLGAQQEALALRIDAERVRDEHDRDEHGEYRHLVTEVLGGRVFLEAVQRAGGYRGHGAADAPARMAAHRRARRARRTQSGSTPA